MPIAYPDILSETSERVAFSYGPKEAILYALGIGLGEDPLDERGLSFVYERDHQVVPTAATVLGGPVMVPMYPAAGLRRSTLNFPLVVHGEQRVEIHRPLASSDALFTETRTIGAYDKGVDKGAIIVSETKWTDARDVPVATLTTSIFARGDGGFGGPSQAPSTAAVRNNAVPDHRATIATRPNQALLYRLNGDSNPLHADPVIAAQAGFSRPILHGLCTYGLTCRAVLEEYADFDASRIRVHQARFSSPVYPGETLGIEFWRKPGAVEFEVTALERGVKVIRNGRTELVD